MKFLSYDGLLYFCQKIKALLAGKVDKVDGKGLSTNDYTTAEKTKLAGLMNYIHPTTSGNKHIPAGGSANQILGWSADGTAKWVNEKDTTYSVMSGATVDADGKSGLVPSPTKGAQRWLDSTGAWTTPPNTTYGAASTTSAGLMSAADKKKLDGVADGANKYVHPATSGNKHIPVGGSDGMILGWSADGTAKWVADKDTTYLQGTESGKVDWNTLKTFGVYKIQSCTMTADYHAPVDEYAFGILQVLDSENGGSENRIIQIYWPHRTSQGAHLWYRMHNSSNMSDGWSNWTAITEKPATAGVADSASSVAWVNVTGKPSTFTPSSHTHNYAGSSSAGGAATSANKVNAALTINLNGTSQGAWDGSSAKSISITAASVGATSVTISRW